MVFFDEQILAEVSEAQTSWSSLNTTNESWEKWKRTGIGIAALVRGLCLHLGIQHPREAGRKWSDMFGQLLRDYGFDNMDKKKRKCLLDLIDNLDAFEAWYNSLSQSERLTWVDPVTLWRKWPSNPRRKPKVEVEKPEDPRDAAIRQLKQENLELQNLLATSEAEKLALDKRLHEITSDQQWEKAGTVAEARRRVEQVEAESDELRQQAEAARSQTRNAIQRAKLAEDNLDQMDRVVRRERTRKWEMFALVKALMATLRHAFPLQAVSLQSHAEGTAGELAGGQPANQDQKPAKKARTPHPDEWPQEWAEHLERRYLKDDMALTDAELCEEMNRRFGDKHTFTEGSIKGKLHKAHHRKEHPLPFRPNRSPAERAAARAKRKQAA